MQWMTVIMHTLVAISNARPERPKKKMIEKRRNYTGTCTAGHRAGSLTSYGADPRTDPADPYRSGHRSGHRSVVKHRTRAPIHRFYRKRNILLYFYYLDSTDRWP